MAIRAANFIICILSIALLYAFGTLGEQVLNLAHNHPMVEHCPGLPSLLLQGFPLNHQLFVLSLTPFMILFLTLPALAELTREMQGLFWHLLVGIWLLAVFYLCLIAIVLLVPFQLLMAELRSSFVRPAVIAIDVFLLGAIAALWVWRCLKIRGSATAPPPQKPE